MQKTNDQVDEQIAKVKEELEMEREAKNYIQERRDMMQTFWEDIKMSVKELKVKLANRREERDKASELHRMRNLVVKQKTKHVLSEYHNTVAEIKTDDIILTSFLEKDLTQSQLSNLAEKHSWQADFREKEFHMQNCMLELRKQHQEKLIEFHNDLEKKLANINATYVEEMQLMTEEVKEQTYAQIVEFEEQMKGDMETLTESQKSAFRGAEIFYKKIQRKWELECSSLKKENADLRMKLRTLDKELSAALQENQHTREYLQESETKLPELHKQLKKYIQTKAMREESDANFKILDQEVRHLKVEYELLLQAFKKVQQQRDELFKKQAEAIQDVQMKSRVQRIQLKKRLKTLTDIFKKVEEIKISGLVPS